LNIKLNTPKLPGSARHITIRIDRKQAIIKPGGSFHPWLNVITLNYFLIDSSYRAGAEKLEYKFERFNIGTLEIQN